ncbi:MAG: hypothetical protein ACREBA_01035 [Nitrosotalea sp.]
MTLSSKSPELQLSSLQFLTLKSLQGNLIFVVGSSSSVGVIISYTPALGKTISFIVAKSYLLASTSIYEQLVQIRNNATPKLYEMISIESKKIDEPMGDTLLGDGTTTYDMYLSDNGSSGTNYCLMKLVIL